MIVLEKNVQRLEKERIVEFCKKKLAGYKCPKVVYPRHEIPRNAMGKMQKQILKDEYSKMD